MTKDETLKICLEYIETNANGSKFAILIKEALAQPEQEPVAWMNDMGTHIDLNVSGRGTPLYTTPPQQELVCVCGAVWEGQELVEAPPQRTWVGLTDQEIDQICGDVGYGYIDVARAIEAKLKENNSNL